MRALRQAASRVTTLIAALGCAPTGTAQAAAPQQLHSMEIPCPVRELDLRVGGWNAGSVLDLRDSDGIAVDLAAASQQVEFIASSIGASESPLGLGFSIEARIEGNSGAALQSIALRDFSTMAFVDVDTRWMVSGTDTVTRVFAPGDPARFVQPGTRQVEAHVSYLWSVPGGAPVVSIDAMGWQTRARASQRSIDLRGFNVTGLNSSQNWIRTVFDLGPDRMLSGADGIQLAFDVTDPGPFDYTFRAELRETNNQTFPRPGTTQVYRMRFDALELPDLYGPVTIFQRFSVANNGPDLEIELTGANQFFNAIPGDLQVVAFGQRLRLGKLLRPKNDLAVAIFNGVQGGYRVSLNGEVLHEASHLDTRAAPQGSWTQFGLYPHGLHDAQNRADQVASGRTRTAFRFQSYSKLSLCGELDLSWVTTHDPN